MINVFLQSGWHIAHPVKPLVKTGAIKNSFNLNGIQYVFKYSKQSLAYRKLLTWFLYKMRMNGRTFCTIYDS